MTPNDRLNELLMRNADGNDAVVVLAEKRLADVYREAYKSITEELASLYAKLGGGATLIEARKYNRLKSLQEEIAREFRLLTNTAIDVTLDTSTKGYTRGFYGTEWVYSQALGTELAFTALSVDAIRSAVWSSMTGEDFSERFRKWAQSDYNKVNGIVSRGLATGEGYKKTARNIMGQLGKSYSEAVRIVRTENTRNYTQGHLNVYDQLGDLGIDARKQWVATIDMRTRHSHARLDGKMADDNGLFHSGGASAEGPGLFGVPEEDINCRCRVVEIVAGFEPDARRIRGEGVVGYVTYADWAKTRGWDAVKGWPIEAKTRISREQTRRY